MVPPIRNIEKKIIFCENPVEVWSFDGDNNKIVYFGRKNYQAVDVIKAVEFLFNSFFLFTYNSL
jgi:hypothetical protein